MARVMKLYEWLARGPSPDCDRILAAGLGPAEPTYFEHLVQLLLRRRSEAAWSGLIAIHHRLKPEHRAGLAQVPELLRAGLAATLANAEPLARRNALALMTEHPCPRLTYLLPDLLRDPSEDVRAAALAVLRRAAERCVDSPPEPPGAADSEQALARAEVAKALMKALRAFDRHYRIAVVEISLWFVRELGADLWRMLENRRSQWAHLAANHLPDWNSPRLARFLIEALARPAWRLPASQLLRRWSRPDEVTAVFRNSDLLTQPEIRRRLGMLKDVAWFRGLGSSLDSVPAELRPQAPAWLACVGLDTGQKLALLLGWLAAGEPDVQRAGLAALARLDEPSARARLEELASGNSPLASTAREQLAAATPEPAPTPAAPAAVPDLATSAARAKARDAPPARRAEAPAPPADCRDRVLQDDADLIGMLQDSAADWRASVVRLLQSTEPRERLLGLRMIATTHGAREFAIPLAPLCDDPVPAIRRLADLLARAGGTDPIPPVAIEVTP